MKRPCDIVDESPKLFFTILQRESIVYNEKVTFLGGVRGVMCRSKNSDTCSFYELLLVEGLYFKT